MLSPSSLLSVAHAQQIIFRSFLFSQGYAGLQLRLLEYVAQLHPAWRLDEEALIALTTEALRSCSRFLEHSWHQPYDANVLEAQVLEYVLHFERMLGEDPRPARPFLLSQVMADMVRRDCLYLVFGNGRPRQSAPACPPQGTLADPYCSHFVQYALLHHPTGVVEFDALFAAMGQAFARPGETLQHCLAQPAIRWCMDRVLAVHNAHSPNHPIAVPPQVLLNAAEARQVPAIFPHLFLS